MKSLYVNGEWFDGHGEKFSSVNPADGSELWHGSFADLHQVECAITIAKETFLSWSKTSFEERLGILEKYRSLLERDKESYAKLISDETGKPVWESLTEVGAMVGKLNHCINSYKERCSCKSVEIAGAQSTLRFKAIGVMVVFGPFNLPGHLPNGHILPALLAGNTIVFKPSEQTPVSGIKLVQLLEEAGLPAGVMNLVQGSDEVGKALCSSENINGVLFTGSYKVGKLIHQSLAGRPEIILALEMGGNNPLIVWDAQDTRAAAYLTIQSAFITSGQRCVCARRLIIPDNEYGELFLQELVAMTKNIVVSSPQSDPEPFIGPVISITSANAVMEAQRSLLSQGAKLYLECTQDEAYVTPGILDVTGMKLVDEEIFGPLLQVIRVTGFDDAISQSNNTKFGLSAGLVSDHEKLYEQFISTSKAGIVNWNRQITGAVSFNPFGGSGYSGNFRPSAYFAADYCAYPVASIEKEKVEIPQTTPPGLGL
ncbi:MAG: succinylglutamate-semialdehyde dehydrogenase [Lentisphaerales bacterium]|nr:succinylglutamate-semialdehyde dehydrogenase [Lentisphaerales bacterium]